MRIGTFATGASGEELEKTMSCDWQRSSLSPLPQSTQSYPTKPLQGVRYNIAARSYEKPASRPLRVELDSISVADTHEVEGSTVQFTVGTDWTSQEIIMIIRCHTVGFNCIYPHRACYSVQVLFFLLIRSSKRVSMPQRESHLSLRSK